VRRVRPGVSLLPHRVLETAYKYAVDLEEELLQGPDVVIPSVVMFVVPSRAIRSTDFIALIASPESPPRPFSGILWLLLLDMR